MSRTEDVEQYPSASALGPTSKTNIMNAHPMNPSFIILAPGFTLTP